MRPNQHHPRQPRDAPPPIHRHEISQATHNHLIPNILQNHSQKKPPPISSSPRPRPAAEGPTSTLNRAHPLTRTPALGYADIFTVEVRRPSVAGLIFRLRFGCPGQKGREFSFRRNRAGRRRPSRLGSPAKSGSLSPGPNGWSAIGVDSRRLPRGRSFLLRLPQRRMP